MKNNTVLKLKRKVMDVAYVIGIITFTILILIKFREPIYDLMWTNTYPLRPAIETSVEKTYDNLDKVVVPVGKKAVNGMKKVGEILDKIPPQF